MSEEGSRDIKSAGTVFDIIDAIAEGASPTTTDIADELDYSRSTIHYYLQTLERRGYARKGSDGYELGPELLRLGGRLLARTDLRRVSDEPLRELSERSPGVACLTARLDERVVVVRTERSTDGPEGDPSTADVHVGTAMSLRTSAYGWAVLANLSADARETLGFDADGGGIPADDLARVRKRGFAFDDQEQWEGVRNAAAPVFRDGDPVGAVGITGTADRIDDPREYAKERRFTSKIPSSLRQAAQSIENRLDGA